MIRTILSAALAALVALPQAALALTCAPADFAEDYAAADASTAHYRLIFGSLGAPLDHTRVEGDDGYRFDAELNGYVGGRDGFSLHFREIVTVEVSCIDPWCPTLDSPIPVLAFVEPLTNGRSVVRIGMCPGGLTYIRPSPDIVNQSRACLAGDC